MSSGTSNVLFFESSSTFFFLFKDFFESSPTFFFLFKDKSVAFREKLTNNSFKFSSLWPQNGVKVKKI